MFTVYAYPTIPFSFSTMKVAMIAFRCKHLIAEISQDIAAEQARFGSSWVAEELTRASSACIKMQYLDKLLREAEQTEANLLER